MTLRATSLSGIANRYLALEPGRNDRATIPDGGEIRAEDGREAVDLDQLLNTLDHQTQRDLQAFVRNAGDAFVSARQANAGLEALNPALSQSAATFRALMRDQEDLERFIVRSAQVVEDVSSRPEHLDALVGNALGAVGALARESAALESAIGRLPPTLRKTNTTLVNLRATLRDVRPLVRDARPGRAAPVGRLRRAARRSRATRGRSCGGRAPRSTGRAPATTCSACCEGSSRSRARRSRRSSRRSRRSRTRCPWSARCGRTCPTWSAGCSTASAGRPRATTTRTATTRASRSRDRWSRSPGSGRSVPRPPEQQGLTGFRTKVDRRCPGRRHAAGRRRLEPVPRHGRLPVRPRGHAAMRRVLLVLACGVAAAVTTIGASEPQTGHARGRGVRLDREPDPGAGREDRRRARRPGPGHRADEGPQGAGRDGGRGGVRAVPARTPSARSARSR